MMLLRMNKAASGYSRARLTSLGVRITGQSRQRGGRHLRLEYGLDQLERLVEALPPLLERHAHRVVVGLGRTRSDTVPAVGA